MKAPPKVPPPPGWGTKPVEGEQAIMSRWDPAIVAMSAKVWHPENLGMDGEDVRQDLRTCLMKAIRQYAWDRKELPPDPFVNTVLTRRVKVLVRNAGVPYRQAERHRSENDHTDWYRPVLAEEHEDPVEAEDRAAIYRAIVYLLRRRLTPKQFAVIQLRYVDDMPVSQLAGFLGVESTNAIGKRIRWAKKRAAAYLREAGIETWEQLAELTPEEFDHEDLD